MDIKISQLLSNTTLSGNNQIVTNVSGPTGFVTKKATLDDLSRYVTGSINNLNLISISGTNAQLSSITASNALFESNIIVQGTASIAQLNTLFQTSLVIGDKYITILSGGVDHTGIDGSGFLWGTSSGPSETTGSFGEHAHILYDAAKDALEIFPGLHVTGSTTVFNISGTSAQFTIVTASLSNLTTNTVVVTGDVSLSSTQHVVLASASIADLNLTLPLVLDSKFRQYIIKKIDPTIYKIIISGSSGETIDGEFGKLIGTQYEAITVVNDGNNKWYLV